jgi:hypothetical protein
MRKKYLYPLFVLIILTSSCMLGQKTVTLAEETKPPEKNTEGVYTTYLPMVVDKQSSADCSTSRLGAILFTEQTSGESTGPYLEALAQEGYTGVAGTPTYDMGAEYFPILADWDRTMICNTLQCLQTRIQHAQDDGIEFEYLSYGPERRDGVPDEEKYNLPWATQSAKEIADQANIPLIISYSTKQLHQEAEERGYAWDDPSQVVALLAPYGDIWMIQAADEYWRLDDNTIRPILSQRVYPPGEEFRAELIKWVGWIKAANPNIKIWIQLGLQRIGVEGENYPDADTLLAYRDSIADLVDGIYITPIYGSVEQFPVANQEMVEAFHRACSTPTGGGAFIPNPSAVEATKQSADNTPAVTAPVQPTKAAATEASYSPEDITLVEEGWTDDLELPCTPSGECMTAIPGYYYRIYENSQYPCGTQGNHQFIVVDSDPNPATPKHLFAKFLGGAVGFWYLDESNERTYFPNENAVGLLTASNNRNMFFRTTITEEHGQGVTKKIRENPGFRIVVPSYCSHDLYKGSGEYNDVDGYNRWGFTAALAAVQYVQANYNTKQVVTYGGSAGAAGAFYIGKELQNVSAIIMDSQAADLSAISQACYDGFNVFGNSYPCFCPEGGQSCMEVLAPRIGFTFNADEPYKFVEAGFDTPIYLIWNERDASIYAHLQYDNLHNALEQYNPGGASVANKVCITDPRTPPGPICNLHVPSGYDFPDTETLVNAVYNWVLQRTGDLQMMKIFLPLVKN